MLDLATLLQSYAAALDYALVNCSEELAERTPQIQQTRNALWEGAPAQIMLE